MDTSFNVTVVFGHNNHDATGPESQIHCRLGTDYSQNPFDTVDVTIQGFIRSEMGTKSTSISILNMTKRKTSIDLEPRLTSKGSTHGIFVDFVFSIPYGSQDSLLPTMSLTGSTYFTGSTVLSDQHVLHGKCDVFYWAVAEFKHKGSIVRRLRRQFEVNQATAPYVLIPSPLSLQSSVCIAKPHTTALLWKGWPLKSKSRLTPRISLSIGRQWFTASNSKHPLLSIPLTLSAFLSLLYSDAYPVQDMVEHGIQNCIVQAKWYKRQSFANSGLQKPTDEGRGDLRITTITVVEQKTRIHFPPLYQQDDKGTSAKDEALPRLKEFSTSSILELLLPVSMSAPSVSTDLLRISYELELDFSFQQACFQASALPWTAGLKIPLVVDMA